MCFIEENFVLYLLARKRNSIMAMRQALNLGLVGLEPPVVELARRVNLVGVYWRLRLGNVPVQCGSRIGPVTPALMGPRSKLVFCKSCVAQKSLIHRAGSANFGFQGSSIVEHPTLDRTMLVQIQPLVPINFFLTFFPVKNAASMKYTSGRRVFASR